MKLSDKLEVVELFTEATKLYKERKFEEALKYFEKALEIDSNDAPSKLYVDRCMEYIKKAPPDDWNGVFIMTTK